MKRITFSGGSVVTGTAIAAAILEYTTAVAEAEGNVTIDIPVLEENGETSVHTLLIGPTSQFDVADADGMSEEEEAARFPVPEMPQVGISGKVDTANHGAKAADQFDNIMREIDEGLGL